MQNMLPGLEKAEAPGIGANVELHCLLHLMLSVLS
jgi:hypothetical protein